MNWKKVKLGEICEILNGGTPKTGISDYWNGNIEWATPADLGKLKTSIIYNTPRKISELGLKNSSAKLFPAYSLILSTRAPIGYLAINTIPMTTNQGCRGIVPKQITHVSFLYYFLKNNVKLLNSLGVGATFKELSTKSLSEIEIPLPPITTQKHIAEVLDKADALRQQNRQLLQHYDDLLQSTFIELFGDPVKNPKGWEVKKLVKVCKQITDGTHFSPPSVEFGVPYITAKHIKNYGVDFERNRTYVSQEEHEKIYSRCKPEKGDVLYIKDGATTGIAAVNPYDFEFSMLSSLALIKPLKGELISQYLVSWLNSEQVKENLISEFMAGAAIKRFTLQKIKSFQIPIPPLSLQQHFAKIVEEIEVQKEQVRGALLSSEELFEGLLAGYFG